MKSKRNPEYIENYAMSRKGIEISDFYDDYVLNYNKKEY